MNKEVEIRITAEISDAERHAERFVLSETWILKNATFSDCAAILERLHNLFEALKSQAKR